MEKITSHFKHYPIGTEVWIVYYDYVNDDYWDDLQEWQIFKGIIHSINCKIEGKEMTIIYKIDGVYHGVATYFFKEENQYCLFETTEEKALEKLKELKKC